MSTDLNKMISDIQKDCSEISDRLKVILGKYENFYQEANRQLYQERSASGFMKGLEDFHHMVQLIKRNRDVIGSLVRGISCLRSLNGFKIIEEDIPEIQPKPKKKRTPPAPSQPTEPIISEQTVGITNA